MFRSDASVDGLTSHLDGRTCSGRSYDVGPYDMPSPVVGSHSSPAHPRGFVLEATSSVGHGSPRQRHRYFDRSLWRRASGNALGRQLPPTSGRPLRHVRSKDFVLELVDEVKASDLHVRQVRSTRGGADTLRRRRREPPAAWASCIRVPSYYVTRPDSSSWCCPASLVGRCIACMGRVDTVVESACTENARTGFVTGGETAEEINGRY